MSVYCEVYFRVFVKCFKKECIGQWFPFLPVYRMRWCQKAKDVFSTGLEAEAKGVRPCMVVCVDNVDGSMRDINVEWRCPQPSSLFLVRTTEKKFGNYWCIAVERPSRLSMVDKLQEKIDELFRWSKNCKAQFLKDQEVDSSPFIALQHSLGESNDLNRFVREMTATQQNNKKRKHVSVVMKDYATNSSHKRKDMRRVLAQIENIGTDQSDHLSFISPPKSCGRPCDLCIGFDVGITASESLLMSDPVRPKRRHSNRCLGPTLIDKPCIECIKCLDVHKQYNRNIAAAAKFLKFKNYQDCESAGMPEVLKRLYNQAVYTDKKTQTMSSESAQNGLWSLFAQVVKHIPETCFFYKYL